MRPAGKPPTLAAMRHTILPVALAALMLAAPAAAVEGPDTTDWRALGEEGGSAYGLYLAGRAALSRGAGQTASEYLTAAQMAAPDQANVRERAFTAALLAGDLDVAAQLAPSGDGVAPTVREAGRLVTAVRDYGAGRVREANAQFAAQPIGFPHARAGAFVAPWIAASAGDWERALAEPPTAADALTRLFTRYHRALLLEHRRRYDEAEAELRTLLAEPQAAPLFRAPLGQFLERRGRRDEAIVLYDEALAGGADDPAVAVARARAAAGGSPPPPPTLLEGAATALSSAAAASVAEGVNEFAVVYLRLSLGLSSEPDTQLALGNALNDSGVPAAARDAWARIGPEAGPLYALARQEIAWSLQAAGEGEQALIEAQAAAAAAPDDPSIAFSLAGILSSQERYEEALEVLNGPALNTAEQSWQVRFTRGAAYERLGRIAEAEAELWAALQAAPDSPEVLNYLGYMWVDSGTRVAEGSDMIARAVAAQPESGHIQDSLGWAQYRQGAYDEAVNTLEVAVGLEPGDPTINDHLGDAYWQVGRRREAGFQWNRVLTLEPEADLRAEVERKLSGGLGPEGSAP